MSNHANTAKMIRKELKQAFPRVKFSVRSSIYSGGSSVDIEWENGPTSDKVRSISDKYQYGHFNGMEDLYELTNCRKDIPQVKYVQVQRNVSQDIKEKVFKWLQETHDHFNEVFSMDECSDKLNAKWSSWTARDYIYRLLVKQDLTNGYCNIGEEKMKSYRIIIKEVTFHSYEIGSSSAEEAEDSIHNIDAADYIKSDTHEWECISVEEKNNE